MRRHFISAVAVAAMAFGAAPVAALPVQASPNADGRALILVPLTLVKVEDLDFGTVVSSAVAGTVTIDQATGARTVAGGVTAVASDPGHRAEFAGAGTPNQLVDISISSVPASLTDGLGNSIPVTLVLDATQVTIDATRAFTVGVGGTIDVAADQPDGDYNADFAVTAIYQ